MADGTGVSPIAFTSWLDDSRGGDTNGDGVLTQPSTTDWSGIHFRGSGKSELPSAFTLDNVSVSYATGYYYGSGYGAVSVSFSDGAQDDFDWPVSITNSRVEHVGAYYSSAAI